MLSTKYRVSALCRFSPSRILTSQDSLEVFVLGPVGPLLLHLAVGIAAAFQRLERLLQGLRHVAVVDHAAPQVHDLVDVLDQQRAFLLAGAAGGAGPDFVFRVNAADQRLAVGGGAEHRVMLEAVIPGFDGDEPGRERPAHGVGRALVRAPAAVGAGVEIQHVLPGEVFEFLNARTISVGPALFRNAPPHRLESTAVQFREIDVNMKIST